MRFQPLAVAATTAIFCASNLAHAQETTLSVIDLSESGTVFRSEIAPETNTVTVHLLDDARWDALEFQVRGATVGSPILFELPNGSADLHPRVTEGNFEWRHVELLPTDKQGIRFAILPGRERFTVQFPRPQSIGLGDAPYYTFPTFIDYFSQIFAEPRAQITLLGKSLQGRPLYRVLIDTPSRYPKKTVLMGVRQHGNEYGSSYVLEGALDLLLERNGMSVEPELLDRVRWIIYPLMNPDGSVASQRGNANGADLNREWSRSGPNSNTQEHEIFIFQSDVEMLDAAFGGIDIGGDHHGWGSTGNHGGFRYAQGQSQSFVSAPEHQEARKDTLMYTKHAAEVWNWSENGGTLGMLRAEMFLRLDFLLHTPEYDSTESTGDEFRAIGRGWLRAMYDTLYAPSFRDQLGNTITFSQLPTKLFVHTDDLDEDITGGRDTIQVTLIDETTGDTEVVTLLETGNQTGEFELADGINAIAGAATTGNGVLESAPGSRINLIYEDNDYPRDRSAAQLRVLDVLPKSEG